MVVTISFLGLEGQTSSSLRNDMTTSTTLQGRRELAMVIILSFLELAGHSSYLSRISAMISSTSLYWGKEGHDHGHHTVLLRTRRADLLFSRR